MKIIATSDMHLEHYQYGQDIERAIDDLGPAEVLILAGDTCMPGMMHNVFKMFADRYEHVLYVLGNHEFYWSDLNHTRGLANDIAAKYPNFHMMDNDIVEINGQRFLGVLAHSVSASDTPITVYTKGVFKFLTAGTFTATNMDNGNPVWPNSGMIVQSRKGTLTGDAAIGTIVGREAATITSGNYIKVKINPGSYRWMYCAPASVTAS